MEDFNPHISQISLYTLLIFTAFWTWTNLPEQAGSTPRSKLATFSVDRWATRIRRPLQEGREAEQMGDAVSDRNPGQTYRYYRQSRKHYEQAMSNLRRSQRRPGYLRRLISGSLSRIQKKERSYSRVDQ